MRRLYIMAIAKQDSGTEKIFFYHKVKFKLALLILVLTLIPLSLLGMYGSFIEGQSLRKQAIKNLDNLVVANSSHINSFIEAFRVTVANFSSDGLIRRLSEEVDLHTEEAGASAALLNEHLVKNKMPTNQNLVGINVVDFQGKIIASTNDAEVGKNEREDEYFREALRLPYSKTFIADYESNSHFDIKEPLIAAAAPLFSLDNSRTLGVIVTYFGIDNVAPIFNAELKKEETLDVYLVNENNLAISQSRFLEKDKILSQVVDTEPVRSCRDGQNKNGVWNDWRDERVYGSSICLADFPFRWTLIAEIAETEVIKPAETFRNLIAIAGIALAGIVIFITFISVDGAVSSLEKLSQFAKKISRGNLNDKVEISSNDEIETLAKSLDLMRETIKVREDNLRETNDDLMKAEDKLRANIKDLESSKTAMMNLLRVVKTSEEKSKQQADELKKFQQATDQSFEQTVITDADGIILYANHATEVITGYGMQEIIGARPSLWGNQMSKEFYETLWRTIKDEKSGYAGEITNKRKDGTKYLASVRIAPILDERGEVKFFVGMTRDITEERQSQLRIVRHTAELQEANVLIEKQKERAESILRFLKSIGEGIFATDVSGRIIFMNETAEILSKKTFEAAELKSANQIFCFAKETETGCSELVFIKDALQKKKTITLPDHTVLIYEGRKRISVSGTCAPIRDAHSEIVGTITVFQDVTQKHELDEMKDNFLSVAAHQLRTPLGSMRWSMELLLSGDFGKLPKSAKKAVQELYNNNQRMAELVDDLLDISRIEQNRGTEEKKLINLAELVTAVQKELQKEADKRKIEIITDFPKDSLPNILVSPKHTHEAIENLLSNAIKYNRDKGKVTIKIIKKEKSLVLTIKDTGIGIPKNDHNKVFSKFFRATNAVLKETEGSGLGLSVVKSYLEESRARISFESEENIGTTFTAEFPLDQTAGIS